MITRVLKVEELICRTRPGGGPSHHAALTIDEVGPICLRISKEEYDSLGLAIGAGARFVVTLKLAPPTLDTLASREAADGAA